MDDKKILNYLKALSSMIEDMENDMEHKNLVEDVFIFKITVNKLSGLNLKSRTFDSPLFEEVTGLTKEEFGELVKKHLHEPFDNLTRELTSAITAKGKNVVGAFDLVRNRKL